MYKYLIESILYFKQLVFQNCHSTDHSVVQLSDQITESFENKKYMLGVFIDLFRVFDTVDHSTLLRKLEVYGMMVKNHEERVTSHIEDNSFKSTKKKKQA